MNVCIQDHKQFKKIRVLRSLATFLSLLFLIQTSVFAGEKFVLYTDVMDDDMHALRFTLSHPELRDDLLAVSVTTGNAHLKAEVARKLLEAYGRANVPVLVGTSTDLTDDASTEFAGMFEREGFGIVSEQNRDNFYSQGLVDGLGVSELAALLLKQEKGTKINFAFLASPVDFVKLINVYPEVASHIVINDGFAMGLYKFLLDGTIVLPFNSRAHLDGAKSFLELLQRGVFENFTHVRSDIVQNNSGLEGGYVSADDWGKKISEGIRKQMQGDPSLRRFYSLAAEYAASWRDYATRTFGPGVGTELDRWVPNSLRNDPSLFYIADLLVPFMLLDKRKSSQMFSYSESNLHLNNGALALPKSESKPANLKVRDVTSVEGKAVMENYVQVGNLGLQHLVPTSLPEINSQNDGVTFEYGHVADDGSGLVVVFKNSGDDWLSLLLLISTEQGRRALKRGGIITEGFNAETMAQSVYAILKSFGVEDIRIGIGHQYTTDEVSSIPNFIGELALVEKEQDSKAFSGLTSNAREKEFLTADQLLSKITSELTSSRSSLDQMIFGEGSDLAEYAIKDSRYIPLLRDTIDMGGVRENRAESTFSITRNWARQPALIIDFLEGLSMKDGKRVFVFSSQDFGGSLVARGASTGSGVAIFNMFSDHGGMNSGLDAVGQHLENWIRIFNSLRAKTLDNFDPNSPVELLEFSPLAISMADFYLRGLNAPKVFSEEAAQNAASITYLERSLTGLKLTSPQMVEQGKIRWLKRPGSYSLTELSQRISAVLGNRVNIVASSAIDHAVRENGVFSSEAWNESQKFGAGLGCSDKFKPK